MTSLKNRTIAALAATIATVATVAAAAPAHAETRAVRLAYADLDLATAQGRAVLAHRVRRAVDTVCGEMDVRDPGQADIARCRAGAFRAAQADLRLALTETAAPRLATR